MKPLCFSWGSFRFVFPLTLIPSTLTSLSLVVLVSLLGACTVESKSGSRGARLSTPTVATITFEAQANVLSIAENAAAGASAGELKASVDSDDGKVSFSIAENDWFELDEATVKLKDSASLDYETTPSYEVVVTAEAEDAEKVTLTLAVTVTNTLENTITFEAQANALSIAVDASPGDAAGTLVASTDGPGAVSFSIAENDWFELDEATVKLKSGVTLDHEAAIPYQIEVTAHAADATDVTLTLTVTNTLENTITFAATVQSLSIAVDASPGDAAGTLIASTTGPGTVSFSIAENDWFELDEATVKLKSDASLNHETETPYQIEVTAHAEDATDVTLTLTVTVTNALENTITFAATAQSLNIGEDASAGDSAGTLVASTDGPGAVSFSIAENDLFELDEAAVMLKSDVSVNYELATSHQIEVTTQAEGATDVTLTLSVAVDPDVQDGSARRPYRVNTPAKLQSMASGFTNHYVAAHCAAINATSGSTCTSGALDLATSLRSHYVVTADIDASSLASEAGFLPIGACTENFCSVSGAHQAFTGSFNGQEFTISGLVIRRPATNGVGLFAVVGETGTVTNLTLADSEIQGQYQVGSLVGYNNGGTVTDVASSGEVRGSQDVGGLIGYNNGGTVERGEASGMVQGTPSLATKLLGGLVGVNDDGAVRSSMASGDVSGTSYVGGLVGVNRGRPSTISDSTASGDVSGTYYVGGLAGSGIGTITESSASGAVSGDTKVGGLAGNNGGNVRNSQASGHVTATNGKAGGLVGHNSGTISDSEALGNVDGRINLGGLVGLSTGTVSQSSASGAASGNRHVGGLVGFNKGADSTVSDSAASGEVSGTSHLGGLVGNNEGAVSQSNASGDASGDTNVGGLIGVNAGSVRNNQASGHVTATNLQAGGLVGYNGGTISDSRALGNVDGGTDLGGLVGHSYKKSTITDSFAAGRVSGYAIVQWRGVGGLVGNAIEATISNSFAVGDVSGNDAVGGLVGRSTGSTVQNSLATGDVVFTKASAFREYHLGGLVGNVGGSTVVSESFATGNVSGGDYTGGLVGAAVGGKVADTYATGTVGSRVAGGLIGHNGIGPQAQRGYCVSAANPPKHTQYCAGERYYPRNLHHVTEQRLRELTCEEAIFEECSTRWDMGTSTELPVPKANPLTPAAFAALESSSFASLDATNPGTNELELDASSLITKQNEDNVLIYAWYLPDGITLAEEDSLAASSIEVTVADPSAAYTLHLTIVEFDYSDGSVERIYTDEVVISAP